MEFLGGFQPIHNGKKSRPTTSSLMKDFSLFFFLSSKNIFFKDSSSHQGGWTFTIKCVVNTTPHLGWTKIPSTVGKYSKIKDNANSEVFIFHIRLKLSCFGAIIGLLSNLKKALLKDKQVDLICSNWYAEFNLLIYIPRNIKHLNFFT